MHMCIEVSSSRDHVCRQIQHELTTGWYEITIIKSSYHSFMYYCIHTSVYIIHTSFLFIMKYHHHHHHHDHDKTNAPILILRVMSSYVLLPCFNVCCMFCI